MVQLQRVDLLVWVAELVGHLPHDAIFVQQPVVGGAHPELSEYLGGGHIAPESALVPLRCHAAHQTWRLVSELADLIVCDDAALAQHAEKPIDRVSDTHWIERNRAIWKLKTRARGTSHGRLNPGFLRDSFSGGE